MVDAFYLGSFLWCHIPLLRKDLSVLEKASHSRDEFYCVFLHNKTDPAVTERCDV